MPWVKRPEKEILEALLVQDFDLWKKQQRRNAKVQSSRPVQDPGWLDGWPSVENTSGGEVDNFKLPEDVELISMEFACVSNEFSERDEPWLFSPENPDRDGWLEAASLEELKVITQANMELLDADKPLPPGVKPLPIILIYCRKREDSAGQRRFKVGHDLSYHWEMLDALIRQSIEGVALLIDWDIHA